jgi:cell division protein FtsL
MTRTPSILFWFGLIIVASIALYRTSDRVQDLNRQLHDLTASIESEQQSIHVLKAEWAYLSSPARVEVSAKKYLALRPTAPKQIAALDDLPDALATRGKPAPKAAPNITVDATPIATIKTSLSVPAPRPVAAARKKPATTVAAAKPSRMDDHMIIERTASAQPLPDSIGSLINQLAEHP